MESEPTLDEIRDKVEQVIAATDNSVEPERTEVGGLFRPIFFISSRPKTSHLIPEVRKLGIDISALYDNRWFYNRGNRTAKKSWTLQVKHIRKRARALGIIE